MRRSNKTRRFNTGKSIVLLILILVLFLLITGILIIGIDKIQGNDHEEYMKVNINDINGWIKWTIPTLDEDSKFFIRNFISKSDNDNSIEVFPFNDDNFILIYTSEGAKILDLNNKKINWSGGGYYESVKVDIYSDTISCKGDLSSKTYYFNKYGEELDKNLKVIKN